MASLFKLKSNICIPDRIRASLGFSRGVEVTLFIFCFIYLAVLTHIPAIPFVTTRSVPKTHTIVGALFHSLGNTKLKERNRYGGDLNKISAPIVLFWNVNIEALCYNGWTDYLVVWFLLVLHHASVCTTPQLSVRRLQTSRISGARIKTQ